MEMAALQDTGMGEDIQAGVYGKTDTKRTKELHEYVSPYYTQEGEGYAKDILAGARTALPQSVDSAKAAAAAYQTAANNPAYSQAQNLGMQTMRGDFLRGTPEFRQQLASIQAGAARRGGDLSARLAQNFALRGAPSTSTAMVQALQSGQAAERAGAQEQAINAIAANQARERMLQYQAPEMIYRAAQMPGQMHATASQMFLNPYQQATGILSADRSPTNIDKYDTIVEQNRKAGIADYAQSALSAYAALYGGGGQGIARPEMGGSGPQQMPSGGNTNFPKAQQMAWGSPG